MADYVVNTLKQQAEMLEEINLSWEEILETIPENVRLKRELNLANGLSELEVIQEMTGLANLNTVYNTILRGAGAYHHLIPSVVKHLAGRAEFLTTYTPYQAEFSQGVLQVIFEYQSMMAHLTGLSASNASVYDGASALAEAVNMTVTSSKNEVYLGGNLHPDVIETVLTYTAYLDTVVHIIPVIAGRIDLNWLKANLNEKTASVAIAQPNYLGILEDMKTIGAELKSRDIALIAYVNPMTLGLLHKPSEYGAAITVGEAQPFGLNMALGGPYLGFMTANQKFMRRLPGRIVGQTLDANGNRAFTLTLQAREQHIRREKATSSICSNQAHCALTAAIYLAAIGPKGLKDVANASYQKAHYFQEKLAEIGYSLKYQQPFFHEFVTTTPIPAVLVEQELAKHNILAGKILSNQEILWCVTETVSEKTLDEVITYLKEVQL